jgi:hypothetical protein
MPAASLSVTLTGHSLLVVLIFRLFPRSTMTQSLRHHGHEGWSRCMSRILYVPFSTCLPSDFSRSLFKPFPSLFLPPFLYNYLKDLESILYFYGVSVCESGFDVYENGILWESSGKSCFCSQTIRFSPFSESQSRMVHPQVQWPSWSTAVPAS